MLKYLVSTFLLIYFGKHLSIFKLIFGKHFSISGKHLRLPLNIL